MSRPRVHTSVITSSSVLNTHSRTDFMASLLPHAQRMVMRTLYVRASPSVSICMRTEEEQNKKGVKMTPLAGPINFTFQGRASIGKAPTPASLNIVFAASNSSCGMDVVPPSKTTPLIPAWISVRAQPAQGAWVT